MAKGNKPSGGSGGRSGRGGRGGGGRSAYQQTGVITVSTPLNQLPRQARGNDRDQNILVGVRSSLQTGNTYYVEPTRGRYSLTTSRPSFVSYYEINGRQVTRYSYNPGG